MANVAKQLCERCHPPREIALRGWVRHQEKHDRQEGKQPDPPQPPVIAPAPKPQVVAFEEPREVVKLDESSFEKGFRMGWQLRGDFLG